MELFTHSEGETIQAGKQIANSLKAGDIVLLFGNMGAGKTTMTKGIAQGLGIQKHITSPTFPLMNVYALNNPDSDIKNFVHIDTYRLKNQEELIAIGVEDYLGKPDTITLIEWPEKIQELLSNKTVKKITLEHVDGESRRLVIE